MKTTTLLGVLAVLDSCDTFSAIAYTYTDHKADNSIEAWIAAWGNARGWANCGGGGSANW